MKRKFKVFHPSVNGEPGQRYKPPKDYFVVMTGTGVFMLYCNKDYYPGIQLLSDVLPKYDIIWSD
jgi:hypothetical protein